MRENQFIIVDKMGGELIGLSKYFVSRNLSRAEIETLCNQYISFSQAETANEYGKQEFDKT